MNKPRLITILLCIIVLGLVVQKNSHSEGLNFAELDNNDDARLSEQQKVIDSLTAVYQDRPVTAFTIEHFIDKSSPIFVYSGSGTKVLDTLANSDHVQLISTAFFNGEPNAKVKTSKGITGYIYYFHIKEFEEVLKLKGLETED
ncbi:hypothetical protein SAMN05216490_0938 [Mucilaginibacter mallensis]|uniref:Uncharacterized protein n=1 Tax=Mucilaginibacter mallensis TaxID=652787 RepID=A0A1H1R7W5_MUCMA|nr:hypothetical protein [Mucilaginibacter mallensis]SDS31801.1 hypothetical protein SAMN05216490_0938 [Mucilaginibacter mallensis]